MEAVHANHANPTALSDQRVTGRRRDAVRAPPRGGRGGAARNHLAAACQVPQHLRRSAIRRRGAAAGGGLHRYPLSSEHAPRSVDAVARRRVDFSMALCSAVRHRRSMTASRSRSWPGSMSAASSCSRRTASIASPTSRARASACRGLALEPACVCGVMVAHVGLDPAKDIRLGRRAPRQSRSSCSRTGKVDAFLGVPPELQEAACPAYRPCDRQQPPLTARGRNIFAACWAGNRDFVRRLSGRDEARAAGRSSRRPICAPATRRGCAQRLVEGGFTSRATNMRWQTLQRAFLRQMARIRRRGHDPLLCAAPARNRASIKIEPAEDHRRRHRLALPRTSSNAS